MVIAEVVFRDYRKKEETPVSGHVVEGVSWNREFRFVVHQRLFPTQTFPHSIISTHRSHKFCWLYGNSESPCTLFRNSPSVVIEEYRINRLTLINGGHSVANIVSHLQEKPKWMPSALFIVSLTQSDTNTTKNTTTRKLMLPYCHPRRQSAVAQPEMALKQDQGQYPSSPLVAPLPFSKETINNKVNTSLLLSPVSFLLAFVLSRLLKNLQPFSENGFEYIPPP